MTEAPLEKPESPPTLPSPPPPSTILPEPVVLQIEVREAKNLKSKNHSQPNPYCVLKLGNRHEFRTETKISTFHPIWRENFKFTTSDSSDVLHLSIYDEKVTQKKNIIFVYLKILTGRRHINHS